jgi:hypothetical protein
MRGDETEGKDWRVVGNACREYNQYLQDKNVDRSTLRSDFFQQDKRYAEELEAKFDFLLLWTEVHGKWSRGLIKDVFPYMKKIENDIGMDQTYLRKFWDMWLGPVEPPVPGCGAFRLPIIKAFDVVIGKERVMQLERFAAPGIVLRILNVTEVPEFRARDTGVQSILSVGIRDGTVWNEGIAESLVRFWQDEVLAWWYTSVQAHVDGQSIALFFPHDIFAMNHEGWMSHASGQAPKFVQCAGDAWQSFCELQHTLAAEHEARQLNFEATQPRDKGKGKQPPGQQPASSPHGKPPGKPPGKPEGKQPWSGSSSANKQWAKPEYKPEHMQA